MIKLADLGCYINRSEYALRRLERDAIVIGGAVNIYIKYRNTQISK